MTTPHITSPILILPAQLRSNPALTSQIRLLINDAFRRSKLHNPEKWDFDRPRFLTNESYYEQLGENAIVALIFDQAGGKESCNESSENQDQVLKKGSRSMSGKVIACAAAVPWKGGWAREGAGQEKGWEIKAVAVHEHEKYLHKGLAVKAMEALEDWVVEKAKSDNSAVQQGSVTLWLLVAECINGVYWKKRGYRKVRSSIEGDGTWGCKTNFELVVYRKEVEFGMDEAYKSP